MSRRSATGSGAVREEQCLGDREAIVSAVRGEEGHCQLGGQIRLELSGVDVTDEAYGVRERIWGCGLVGVGGLRERGAYREGEGDGRRRGSLSFRFNLGTGR
jgi:hypothetical protein